MVEYCPNCHAQLPPGLEKCPSCGHKLMASRPDEVSMRDIFRLAASVLLIVLVPVLIVIGIVWVIIANLK